MSKYAKITTRPNVDRATRRMGFEHDYDEIANSYYINSVPIGVIVTRAHEKLLKKNPSMLKLETVVEIE